MVRRYGIGALAALLFVSLFSCSVHASNRPSAAAPASYPVESAASPSDPDASPTPLPPLPTWDTPAPMFSPNVVATISDDDAAKLCEDRVTDYLGLDPTILTFTGVRVEDFEGSFVDVDGYVNSYSFSCSMIVRASGDVDPAGSWFKVGGSETDPVDW